MFGMCNPKSSTHPHPPIPPLLSELLVCRAFVGILRQMWDATETRDNCDWVALLSAGMQCQWWRGNTARPPSQRLRSRSCDGGWWTISMTNEDVQARMCLKSVGETCCFDLTTNQVKTVLKLGSTSLMPHYWLTYVINANCQKFCFFVKWGKKSLSGYV